MNRNDAPKKQPVPFGVNGQREDLLPSTPAGDNTASYADGFPPVTMIIKAAGGLPPKGQDMNQILFELSSLSRWMSAGAINAFDQSFSSSIGGYPKASVLVGDDGITIFISLIDANNNNPNSNQVGWLNLSKITSIAALPGGENKLPYFNGVNTVAQTDLTSLGRDLIGKTSAYDVLSYLGIPNPFLIKQRNLPSTTNLNTIGSDDQLGIYAQPANSGATIANNYPEAIAGTLLVLPSSYGGMQVYITYNGAIYQRQTSNSWNGSGPWGIWLKIPTIDDLNTKQPKDNTLTAIASLTGLANTIAYFNGVDSAALTPLTSLARTILGRTNPSDIISDLGLGAGFGWVNLPGGKILQWNRGNTNDEGTRFSFPLPFPNQCHGVLATPFMTIDGAVINPGSSIATIFVSSSTIDRTGFFAKYANGASTNEFFWFAIGE